MAKIKHDVSFKTWVTTLARARGKAEKQIAALKAEFPTFKRESEYEKRFPIAYANFDRYRHRGSQKGTVRKPAAKKTKKANLKKAAAKPQASKAAA